MDNKITQPNLVMWLEHKIWGKCAHPDELNTAPRQKDMPTLVLKLQKILTFCFVSMKFGAIISVCKHFIFYFNSRFALIALLVLQLFVCSQT